jgi:hypothetical protein
MAPADERHGGVERQLREAILTGQLIDLREGDTSVDAAARGGQWGARRTVPQCCSPTCSPEATGQLRRGRCGWPARASRAGWTSSLARVRLARSAALAATLVPSSAITPSWTRPAAAHGFKDLDEEVGQGLLVAGTEPRDRHVVGDLVAARTRKARSSVQRRWICREERTPIA